MTSLAALSLTPHALAPVAELPVREIVSSVHMVCDLTLGFGKVVHDYLRCKTTRCVSQTSWRRDRRAEQRRQGDR